MVIVWRLRGNIIRTVLYIANVLPFQWAQLTINSSYSPVGPWVWLFVFFLGCMICLYVGVCFVLPWTVESFPFMFWRWRNKLKWAPFELFASSPLLRVRSWLHPFKGHCEQQAMRDEGVIYVAGHPLLNRRCTRLPGCIRLRNDLYCVEWGVKLYSLTHFRIAIWLFCAPFELKSSRSVILWWNIARGAWTTGYGKKINPLRFFCSFLSIRLEFESKILPRGSSYIHIKVLLPHN